MTLNSAFLLVALLLASPCSSHPLAGGAEPGRDGRDVAPSPAPAPLRVTELDVPQWVEVGTMFTVAVAAVGDGGVAAVELSFEGRPLRLEADGGTQVRVSTRLSARESRLQPIEAVAVGVDGRKSEPLSAAVAVSASDWEPGIDETRDFLTRLADDRYVRKNGSAPYQKDPLQTKGKISFGKYADHSSIHLEPWWVRWQDGGGGPAFDWKAECGSWIGSIGPFGEVLTCWLALHPQVAQHLVWEEVDLTSGAVAARPYSAWTGEQKTQLNAAFYQAWAWLDGGLDWFGGEYLFDPPANQITLLDCQTAVTGLTREQAWKLYLGTVAHSLALEIGGFVPWSIAGYAPVDLDVLLHSKSFFYAGKLEHFTKDCPGSQVSFIGYAVPADVIPAPATKTFEFLVEKDLIRPNHFDSVARLLAWARSHMLHIIGGRDTENMEAFYQYRGTAPASRVFEGTVYTDPYTNDVLGPAGFSPGGCHGVSFLFEAMMRVANLPVQPIRICGHRVPVFGTIGHTLSHGDDVYSKWANVEPAFPASLLLISNYTFDYWLAGPGGDCANIARRPREIARQLLPNELVQMYCDDVANGLGHAEGSVFEEFKSWYDVSSLEAFGLWTKLATKAGQLGYCDPP